MNSLTAKFRVLSVEEQFNGVDNAKSAELVKMSPVYSSDPTSENYSFSKYTPGGSIEMYITNPNAFGFYRGGQEYYVDFVRPGATRRYTPDVEQLAVSLHEAGREAVERNLIVRTDVPTRGFIEWGDLTEEAREGRRVQARYLLKNFDIKSFWAAPQPLPQSTALVPQCCEPGCGAIATREIQGKDGFEDYTHSCEGHLASLCGDDKTVPELVTG